MTTPKHISFSILEEITNGFSPDSRIGWGGFADVYKGVYNEREIVVKLLRVDVKRGLNDQQFKNEVGNHWRAKHKNIVQFVGYCYETRKIYVNHNGAHDFSERIYRAICSDYLKGGSLDKRLYDQSFAPDWSTRYNIIKGICEGLNFLHNCVPPILHLDLKPANILLDSSMEAKVADLGLSRLFTQSKTHVTKTIGGTRTYMAPEFLKGMISPKNDVYSLGYVMIDIMTAPGHFNSLEVGNVAQLMQQVLANCTMVEATSLYRSEEIRQLETCVKLAIRCVDSERDNRPSVANILDTLNKTETYISRKQLKDVPLHPATGPKNKMDNSLKTTNDEQDKMKNEDQNCYLVPEDSNSNVQRIGVWRDGSLKEAFFVNGTREEKRSIIGRTYSTLFSIYCVLTNTPRD